MSKLLSQGSFGCVYYPSLNCQGKSEVSKEYLSKLQKKDFNSENEKNIGKKIIANIPNYKKHFVPILSCHSKWIHNRYTINTDDKSITNCKCRWLYLLYKL